MKIITIIATTVFLMSSGIFANSLEGVFSLSVQDSNSKAISSGAGFAIYDENTKKPMILTSFHLVNSVLLGANKIKINNGEYSGSELSILFYDELNDILILSAPNSLSSFFDISDNCQQKVLVAAYHKDQLLVLNSDEMIQTKFRDLRRLPIYLNKGFSGAPVLNENAGVCGMVALSSESNASSVVITSQALRRAVSLVKDGGFSIKDLRVAMGLEHVVGTQEELNELLSLRQEGMQIIVKLNSRNMADFIIRDAKDIIIEAVNNVNRIVVYNSENIMLRGLSSQRVMIDRSRSVLISSSKFENVQRPILLRDSQDVLIRACTFSNIDDLVISKASQIDAEQIGKDNSLSSVRNVIRSI
jgi:uncharacterized protein YfiM (DUF2279 family)